MLVDVGSVVGIMLGTLGGSGGGAVGLALAAGLIAKRGMTQVRPIIWLGVAIIGVALHFLLRSVLFRLDSVLLPSYLPAAWIVFTCTAMLGLLIGAGVPVLVYALVVEGYRLLE